MPKRLFLPMLLGLALSIPSAAAAAAGCQFVLGFAGIAAAVPQVGQCTDNQATMPNGDAQQHATGGLLVWRKADNWTAFTDGYQTWINGPHGLQSRLNTQHFVWEPAAPPATDPAGRAATYCETGSNPQWGPTRTCIYADGSGSIWGADGVLLALSAGGDNKIAFTTEGDRRGSAQTSPPAPAPGPIYVPYPVPAPAPPTSTSCIQITPTYVSCNSY